MPKKQEQGDPQATNVYTYLGYAVTFQASEDAEPIAQGETVSLTAKQIKLLMKSGHRFGADSQAGQAVIEAGKVAMENERNRLEAEAAAKQAIGQS